MENRIGIKILILLVRWDWKFGRKFCVIIEYVRVYVGFLVQRYVGEFINMVDILGRMLFDYGKEKKLFSSYFFVVVLCVMFICIVLERLLCDRMFLNILKQFFLKVYDLFILNEDQMKCF